VTQVTNLSLDSSYPAYIVGVQAAAEQKEKTMPLDTEKTATLLAEQVRVAKSRRNNQLTENEIHSIISVLSENNLFTPDEPATSEKAPKVTWIGLDEGNDARYDADTKREVMEAWVTDLGISRSAVRSVRTGTGSYLVTAPTGPGKVAVMALTRSDMMGEPAPQEPAPTEPTEPNEPAQTQEPNEPGSEPGEESSNAA
jgi:hypothetical protein